MPYAPFYEEFPDIAEAEAKMNKRLHQKQKKRGAQ